MTLASRRIGKQYPNPMDDPATRVDHYLAEAERYVKAAQEAAGQIADPIEASYARTEILKLTAVVIECGIPPDAA